MKINFKNPKLVLLGLAFVVCLHAEEQAPADPPAPPPKMAILPTTDLTSWGLAEALQYSLGKLAVQTNLFNVGSSTYVLPAFSRKELKKAFESNRSPFLMFAYIEASRVSIFLFNAFQPGKFIASNRSLENHPEGKMSSQFVESQFRGSFEDALSLHQKSEYQVLPMAEGDEESDLTIDAGSSAQKSKSQQLKDLFQEVSKLEDKPFYVAANIGMARYTGVSTAASTVNLGVSMGGRLSNRLSAAIGVDFFSYLFTHGDGIYKIPLGEKYISLSVIGSLGSVMGSLTENKGYGSENTVIKTGSFLFGPGLAIDIPLLGATIRGELRYYMGSSSILIGSYGLIISI